jgi:hypothetical protein
MEAISVVIKMEKEEKMEDGEKCLVPKVSWRDFKAWKARKIKLNDNLYILKVPKC